MEDPSTFTVTNLCDSGLNLPRDPFLGNFSENNFVLFEGYLKVNFIINVYVHIFIY